MAEYAAPRRSERRNKGQKPHRLGYESTPTDKKSPEEKLIETQIQRTELELSLLRVKAKEMDLLRKSGRSPYAEGKGFDANFLQKPVPEVVKVDVHAPPSGLNANAHKFVPKFTGKPPYAEEADCASVLSMNLLFPEDKIDNVEKDDAFQIHNFGKLEVKDDADTFTSMSYGSFRTAVGRKGILKGAEVSPNSSDGESSGDESDNESRYSMRSSGSHIAEAIREQSKKMNKFMSRQSLGRESFYFSGNFQEYQLFVQWFWGTTKTCQFTPQENIVRLQHCLKGEAREAVRFMLYSPQCIGEIFRILDKRFGKPEFLVKTVIAEARELPLVKEERPETVIKMSTVVLNMVASMKMCNMMSYLDNPQLLEELLSKLPISLRVQWSEYVAGKSRYSLDTFSRWIEKRADAASERVQFMPAKETKDTKKENHRDKRSKVVAATNEVKPNHDTVRCDSCGGQHELFKCDQFKQLPCEERWKLVKDKKLCFFCLKGGHSAHECPRKKKKCSVANCGMRHNDLLHRVGQNSRTPGSSTEGNGQVSDNPGNQSQGTPTGVGEAPTGVGQAPTGVGQGTVAHTTVRQGHILMKILPVMLSGPKGTTKTYAFLDEGSTITMMKKDLADRLGLEGPAMPLRWQGTTPEMTSACEARVVNVKIKGSYSGAKEYTLKRVRAIDNLALPKQSVDFEKLVRDWRYLSQGNVESYENAEPEILIGLDNIAVISSLEVIHGPWNAPYLARTLLGWVVLGNVGAPNEDVERSCAMFETVDELHEMVKQSFTLESFGAAPQQDPVRSRDDKKAMEIMQRTTKQTSDGRYETGLLWRQGEPPEVPESRLMAMKRLYSTEKKLDRDPVLAKAYCDKMMDHIRKGYLVKLDDNDRRVPADKVWYLPHFSVVHPAKKKIRVVFDCAAKSRGVCLNDMLLTGPDMLQPLPSILMNFRCGKYGYMGDIKEMFHRVKIREEDQNYQRILWRGMNRDCEPEEYKFTAMTFGASCSPTLAAYVKDLNAKSFADEYPEAVKDIIEHTYCDDFIACADSVEEARKRVGEVIKIHKNAGFDVVNWTASDPAILTDLDTDSRSKSLGNSEELERVLGLWWDPKDDAFTFKVNFHKVPAEILSGEKVPTKRDVLRLVMSIFDPIGFLSMFSVKGKILLQNIWRHKIGWDDEIGGELMNEWSKFLAELYAIEKVSIPRCLSQNLMCAISIELHIFGDASSLACAAVAYLRIECPDEVETAFMCSRTRVAPLKAETIPRMELHAATISSRIGQAVTSGTDVKIDRIYHWSDSMTVIHWLRNGSKKFKQFVSNRLAEIEELTDIDSWHWVPSKSNAADLATRLTPCDFSNDSMWFGGPKFLTMPKSEWPKESRDDTPVDESEMLKEYVNAQREKPVKVKPKYDDKLVANANNCSTWNRLLRATARVPQMARHWMNKVLNKEKTNLPPLTVPELKKAEIALWKDMQLRYAEEKRQLEAGEPLDPESRLFTWSPFVDDDGVMRMKSRLINSPHVDEKFPIILDDKHPATKLLALDAHVRNFHQGQEQVVNDLRRRFRMHRIRSAARRTWIDCQRCRNLRAQPAPPEMAPLPAARVKKSQFVFARSGVDFFGPITVTVGRRQEKRWGVLFTCMATRAVHLEVAHSLDTSSAIMAIRRFIARRGPVQMLFSDNGTNFHGAHKELRAALLQIDHVEIQNQLSTKSIEWIFNPPSAPHMGGSWERLIRSVKTALKATLAFHTPTDEVLLTLFAEVEYMVNNRPLTHVSVDPHDPVALTPNHFFFGELGEAAENRPGTFDDADLCLRKSWRKAQRLTDLVWQRWVRELLPDLARRTKWYKDAPQIQIGSVVVIADDKLPRNNWPLGIVESTYPGKDGKIRSVDVKTAKGIYKRPVAKLCVLDVGATAPRVGEC